MYACCCDAFFISSRLASFGATPPPARSLPHQTRLLVHSLSSNAKRLPLLPLPAPRSVPLVPPGLILLRGLKLLDSVPGRDFWRRCRTPGRLRMHAVPCRVGLHCGGAHRAQLGVRRGPLLPARDDEPGAVPVPARHIHRHGRRHAGVVLPRMSRALRLPRRDGRVDARPRVRRGVLVPRRNAGASGWQGGSEGREGGSEGLSYRSGGGRTGASVCERERSGCRAVVVGGRGCERSNVAARTYRSGYTVCGGWLHPAPLLTVCAVPHPVRVSRGHLLDEHIARGGRRVHDLPPRRLVCGRPCHARLKGRPIGRLRSRVSARKAWCASVMRRCPSVHALHASRTVAGCLALISNPSPRLPPCCRYFCPAGSIFATANACPAGTYSSSTSLSAASQCTGCPTGSFCIAGSSAPTPCYAGSYANATNSTAALTAGTGFPECAPCPAGFACAAGTVNPAACGAGRVSGPQAGSCTACVAGYYW